MTWNSCLTCMRGAIQLSHFLFLIPHFLQTQDATSDEGAEGMIREGLMGRHTHTLTLTCWLITLSHAAALIYCLRFVLELLNFFHIYKQLFSSNKHAPHPHHPWPWSQQTTKFLFFFALLKSGEDDSLRILIRLCVCMSLCVSVWVIFTSNSVKLNGKAKWYMYIVQLYNNKVSVWLEYLFIIFLNA